MGFERRPTFRSFARQAPSTGVAGHFAGLEGGYLAEMMDRGHPYCDGGAWLRRRVRFGHVDEGQALMRRGCSCGAVAGTMEFADADQMPLAADRAAGDVDSGEA